MKKWVFVLILIVVVGGVGFVCGVGFCRFSVGEAIRDTVVERVVDSVPVVRDSVVVRVVERTLMRAEAESHESESHEAKLRGTVAEDIGDTLRVDGGDSVRVVVPISQIVYEGEDYKAYVSGFEARLDSIFVDRRTVTVSKSVCRKPPRVSVGIVGGVGYGVMHRQADCFVGVGVSFRLFP